MRPNTRTPSKKPRKTAPPQQVRIIGGLWKRALLPIAGGEGLRPTPDRVRETVFNWLNHLLERNWERLHCLDLFSGSGALGFEAASRGAASVVMIENSGQAYTQLQASREKLKADRVKVIRGDAERVAQGLVRQGEHFNLIFLDPPYRLNMLEKMLPLCTRLLTDDGIVYAESEFALLSDGKHDAPAWMDAWEVVRADKAGNVFYHLLRAKRDELRA